MSEAQRVSLDAAAAGNAPVAVAVVRFNAAGDVILTGPVLAALARAWPSSRRVMVTHARLTPLLAGNPHITDVVALAPQASVRTLVAPLKELGVDALCDLHGSWRSRALTWLLAPARRSTSVKRTWHDWAAHHLAHAPYRPQVPQLARHHAAAVALVGRPLGAEPLIYHLTAGQRSAGAELLRRHGVAPQTPRVALLPGAAWATKRWPVAHFAVLARRLLGAGAQP